MAKEAKKEDEDEKNDAEKLEGDEAAEGEGTGEDGKGKRRKRIIIAAGALVLLVALAGGAAYYFMSHGKPQEAESAASKAAKVEQPVYFDLPQILVNLNTGGKQTSFIKATVTLELSNKEDEPVVQANLPRLMDSYNTFLREMRATDLYGSAGIYRLREEMLSRANTILAPVQVKDVLFREILVQ